MIVFYILGFLLLCGATVILLELTPERITNDLMKFICDDMFDRMSLTLDGTFELDLSAEEMEKLVGYTGVSYYSEQEDVEDLEE